MTEKVSTLDVRQRLGDMLNRVALRHDEFVIERKGKPLAALVPVERLEQMRRAARLGLKDFLDCQKERPGNLLSDDEAMDLGIDAQRSARRQLRKEESNRKRPRK
ncbi:MAG: type II toxin-antitoxin system prevent-host-death family antitoxin [Myxococcota bacterium]|mgnify:CR=1 FL=1